MKKMTIIALAILVFVLTLPYVVFAPRILKDYNKKKAYQNTYAITNVKYGNAIRVRDASNDDGAEIILYSHHNWECMTWQRIGLEGDSFLLKNLYTQKTFQPSATPQAGVGIVQQTMGGSRLQYWEFIKLADETYLIRAKETDLYLTATGDGDNAAIVLKLKQGNDDQSWKLVRQNPII